MLCREVDGHYEGEPYKVRVVPVERQPGRPPRWELTINFRGERIKERRNLKLETDEEIRQAVNSILRQKPEAEAPKGDPE